MPDNNGLLYSFGPYVLDFSQRCLYNNDDRTELSSNQFALLNVLAQHAGKPFSREQLSYLIKGKDNEVDCRSVDTQIYRLRRMLENGPAKPVYLQTVRGVGSG